MNDFMQNNILICAILGNIIAQVLKVVINFFTEKEFNIKRLIGAGGMPSSHSSTVAALATAIYIEYGINSPYFALAVIFGLIVLSDAAGVRNAAGKHAEILNVLKDDLQYLLSKNFDNIRLKELLGHTRIQVIIGTLIGIGTALTYYWII
jgi:hypothetical protein